MFNKIKDTQYVVDYIDKGQRFRTESIYLSKKNRCMAYCNELPYGILSYSNYINPEEMIVVSYAIEKNEFKLLRTKSVKMAPKNAY